MGRQQMRVGSRNHQSHFEVELPSPQNLFVPHSTPQIWLTIDDNTPSPLLLFFFLTVPFLGSASKVLQSTVTTRTQGETLKHNPHDDATEESVVCVPFDCGCLPSPCRRRICRGSFYHDAMVTIVVVVIIVAGSRSRLFGSWIWCEWIDLGIQSRQKSKD